MRPILAMPITFAATLLFRTAQLLDELAGEVSGDG